MTGSGSAALSTGISASADFSMAVAVSTTAGVGIVGVVVGVVTGSGVATAGCVGVAASGLSMVNLPRTQIFLIFGAVSSLVSALKFQTERGVLMRSVSSGFFP